MMSTFSLSSIAQDTLRIADGPRNDSVCELTGSIKDGTSGLDLIGANIFVTKINIGGSTDENGQFSLQIPVGTYKIRVSYIGYNTQEYILDISGGGVLDFVLEPSSDRLEEVVITASDPKQNLESVRMGVSRLSVAAIEALPPFIGETDILKSLVLLPGVISVGEASAGVNVRGGGADENLILLGGAPIYNPSHLFGFFSAFNSDLINNVTIYKGGIPSKYGGRASSIISMDYKAGNFNKWSGSAALGTIASKFTASGPVIKEKLSVVVGGRISYANWLLGSLNSPDLNNSATDFYDANLLATYRISDKSKLEVGLYNSKDNFNLLGENEFGWENRLGTLNWNYAPSPKLFIKAGLATSLYDFSVKDLSFGGNFNYSSGIDDKSANLQVDYYISPENSVTFGAFAKSITIDPGEIAPLDVNSDVNEETIASEKGQNIDFFLQHDITLGKLALSYGARYSTFKNVGPGSYNTYDPFLIRDLVNVQSTIDASSGETIASYDNIEPRVSMRYLVGERNSLKLGYNRMAQYLGLISNTTSIAPTDIWKLADFHIEPLKADQFSLGYFLNFGNERIEGSQYEASLELYYKSFDNVTEYKDGADLILNENIETELLTGIGRAYGAEVLIKKTDGQLTGWLSYTFSRSLRRVVGFYEEETINAGAWYPSNFDKPHDLTAVIEYEVGPKMQLSSIFTYSEGRPVSYPVAKFDYQGQNIAFYDIRNDNRVPAYHRLDFSMTFNFGADKGWLSGDWILSVYNVYGRRNAFSVFFDDLEGQAPQAYRLSTLGIPFPSLSYKLKF